MSKYAKWIGAGLGVAFGGGIIGGVLGFVLGSMFDDTSLGTEKFKSAGGGQRFDQDFRKRYANQRFRTTPQDFAASLMVLSAAVMKADGKLMKTELNYIRDFFTKNFGSAVAAEQIGILKTLLKKDIPTTEVCGQIRYLMEHSARLQLLHYLFGIAKADGRVDGQEASVIEKIARDLGISTKDYESIRAMFFKDPGSAYKILEVSPDATDSEIKKAYRKMATKYHPDKVSHLGEATKEAAEEKFVKVQEAYETIKAERGMK